MAELDLEKARYEAQLAERRYAACDPENRLIAAQLERSWETALRHVKACEERIERCAASSPSPIEPDDLQGLAEDLQAAWGAPSTTMRTRQRLVRTLIEDIIADLDEASGEVVLRIHWKGGQHSELRTRKPKSGEHRRRAPDDAHAMIRNMAGKWSDEHIAACLNRMGFRTGQNQSWTARRVQAFRGKRGIRAYRSAEKDGQWLTMSEAATTLGVTNHTIRRLIREGLLPAEQVVPRAPYQIRAADLRSDGVRGALTRRVRPCRTVPRSQDALFPIT
jgi:excisionase family DNA binding protein